MKTFFEAIQTAFNADPAPAVAGLLTSGLFYDSAPQGTAVPYGVVHPIFGGNADSFSHRITNLRLQISIHTQADSSADCWAACDAMTDFWKTPAFRWGMCPTGWSE